MSENVLVALIAATVSASLFILAELLRWLYRRLDRRESSRSVYRRYVDPISIAATGLLWRLREVFNGPESGYFLRERHHHAIFERYKAISTLYRLAVLLAWMRGLRRELFFLSSAESKAAAALELAIGKFQGGLADGDHMEEARVEAVLLLLPDAPVVDLAVKRQAGTRLDYELDRMLNTLRVEELSELDQVQARGIVLHSLEVVCSSFGMNPPRRQISDDELQACFARLSIPEAWIYRDWQAAIGDLMLRDSQGGDRRFDVIGYREFEEMCVSGTDEEKKWLRRLNSVLDGVDLSAPDLDARVSLLRNIYAASGEILLAIHELDRKRSSIDPRTLAAARESSPALPR